MLAAVSSPLVGRLSAASQSHASASEIILPRRLRLLASERLAGVMASAWLISVGVLCNCLAGMMLRYLLLIHWSSTYMIAVSINLSGRISELLTAADMESVHYAAGMELESRMRDHLRSNGGSRFWGAASESAKLDRWDDKSAAVGVYKRGVALQRYGSGGLPGGVVRPVRAKHLTIPAVKGLGSVRESGLDLVFVPAKERGGQYAGSLCPAGVKTITRGKRKGQSRKVAAGAPVYHLYNWTVHDPHPDVLPTDEALGAAVQKNMDSTLRRLMRRNARRNANS